MKLMMFVSIVIGLQKLYNLIENINNQIHAKTKSTDYVMLMMVMKVMRKRKYLCTQLQPD